MKKEKRRKLQDNNHSLKAFADGNPEGRVEVQKELVENKND